MIRLRPNCITFFLLFFLISPAVFSRGQQEGDPLVQAVGLIEAKQYNDAITLLVQEIKANPHRFDELQGYLRKIQGALEEIKGKYSSLLEAYEIEPQRANQLIKELRALEPQPTVRGRKILLAAEDIIRFIQNRNQWEDIMETALAQLNQGHYWEAVLTYYGGFDLARKSFEDADYGESTTDLVDRRKAAVEELLGRFARLKQPLKDLLEAEIGIYNTIEDRNSTSYKTVFDPLLREIPPLAKLLLSLEEAAQFFLDQEEVLRLSQGDEQEVHHLLYLFLLISGRPNSEVKEGISGAVERLWGEILDGLNKHTASLLVESFLGGQGEYREENDQASRAAFQEAQEYASLYLRSLGAWANRFPMDISSIPDEEDRKILTRQLAQQANARIRDTVAGGYLDLIDHRRVIKSLNEKQGEIRLPQEGRTLRNALLEERDQLLVQRDRWEDTLADLRSPEEEGQADSEGQELATLMVREIDILLEYCGKVEVVLVGAVETLERAPLQTALALREELYQEAMGYLEGLPLIIGEGTDAQEVSAVYPDRALEIFQRVSVEFDRLSQTMTALQNRLRIDTTWEQAEIQRIFAEGENFLASLQDLTEKTSRFLFRAEDEMLEANRLRQEGDRYFQEARRLTEEEEFSAARERLTRTATLYEESLTHQEDPGLRDIRDRGIPEFFDEIYRRENLRVIQDVRGYLTQGQILYTRNEFTSANSLFLRAETRWADTHVESNGEIVYWLELTRIALSITTRREFALTDPLFTEMAQYVNQAFADYERGSQRMAEGDRGGGEAFFDDAEENLFLVQQFFPFNKDVRLLTIKIAQQRDPDGFEDLLQRDFSNARNKIRFNPQEAYVDLQDLEALVPDYPGLQAAIEEAEYAVGIRVRPPDLTKIRQSQELYQQALSIVDSNVRTEFSMAQAFLDEAFALNPSNQDILLLKDKLAVYLGGTVSSILSSIDQGKYAEAVDEYNNGNYLKARILVDILLENPDNRHNTRLLELKERIQSAR